jgi:aspartokinase
MWSVSRRVATLVAAEAAHRPVAVVVSAMAGRTNEMVPGVDSAGRPRPDFRPTTTSTTPW